MLDKIPAITFTDKEAEGIVPHHDNLVVLLLTTTGYQISRVLVHGRSSANVIFWTSFEAPGVSKYLLRPFHDTLLGFSSGKGEVRRNLYLRKTFGEAPATKIVRLTYMVVDIDSPYNAIIGRPALNSLTTIVSYAHLCMKFLVDRKVGVVRGNQQV